MIKAETVRYLLFITEIYYMATIIWKHKINSNELKMPNSNGI